MFELTNLQESVEKVREELHKIILGQDEMIDLLLATVLVGGHALIEGVPGIAKTVAAKMLARTIDARFTRIQFTPDLMPSDVTGTVVFNMKTSEFSFNKGPIFSNIVLIDEINRAPAKTQAALFEVMEERQVSIDGTTHKMGFPFMVLATQNPIEQEGTYKLPEAQLDRFLFKIKISYPNLEEEKAILHRFKNDFKNNLQNEVQPVLSAEDIRNAQNLVEQIYISDDIINYIAQIVHSTRNNNDLYLGASPRASLAIMRSSKAFAAMNGRDFITPDDVRRVAKAVLNHRIILTPEREMEGMSPETVIDELLSKIEVPR